jgi:UDP-4-amino-4-deoxy-L-arabinose formyltransferase/UDP-glucuronic acid dehydrogenase (UDP-4-keto-hexauronic acid decarboxylating)
MTNAVDAGPIAFQKAVAISETDTPPILLRNCIRAGMPLLSELLALVSAAGHIPRISQDLSRREYFGREIPADGHIDWNRPAQEIVNLTRAFDHRPFPCPFGYLTTAALGPRTAVLKTEDTGISSGVAPGTVIRNLEPIRIAAADHWVLVREHFEAPSP